jgi:hypothetical protein
MTLYAPKLLGYLHSMYRNRAIMDNPIGEALLFHYLIYSQYNDCQHMIL